MGEIVSVIKNGVFMIYDGKGGIGGKGEIGIKIIVYVGTFNNNDLQ